jgi:PAS domain S-box-containing protein
MPEVRVLHVDDDGSLLGLASAMLERRGFDVVTATDVERALDVLDSEPVDCVISDYQMPDRNGLEFLERVREQDPALPFVLFTGKGSEEVASDAIAAGVTDYLQKRTAPGQFEELADRVERAVRERRTAEGLSEGDRILTALVETLSGVVYRLRLPGKEPTFLGGRVEELTGHDAAAFRDGRVTWDGITHEDDRGRVEREVGKALAEGRAFDVTCRIRTKSGRVRRVSNRGRGVYDGDGEPVAVEGFVLDRSDGAHEARVRELHEATRQLFAADSVEAVARLTAEAARDVLGYPINGVRLYDEERHVLVPVTLTSRSEDVLGERPAYPVGDGDPMETGSYPVTAFRTGRPVVVDEFGEEDRPVRAGEAESAMYLPLGDHGTLTVVATEAASFEATDREVAGILAENAAVALDRVLHEETLATERDRLAALFENIPDPAVQIEFADAEPVVEAVNPAFESTFGYPESTVVGRSLDEVIVPVDDREAARGINERIRAGESLHAEVRRETADGVRDFLLHVVPRSRESATAGYAIYTDVTERRERERELARQNERLEEFASVVSHDLRNPLNVAEGQLEIARATGASEAFDAVERAHDRMESRIEGLLDLARHGRTTGRTDAVDLAEVSRTAWESVGTDPARLDLEDGLPTVEADRERLLQLLENLFANAVAHGTGSSTVPSGDPGAADGKGTTTTAGTGDVEVVEGSGGGRPHEVTDRGGSDRSGPSLSVTVGPLDGGFYVADDGVGLPDGVRERVFEPGYSTGEDGTGFGLAIVRSIAEAHGWSVAATEGTDVGARFEFTGVELFDDGPPDAETDSPPDDGDPADDAA